VLLKNPEKKLKIEKLEMLIAQAVDKIGGTKENDICHYIPSDEPDGGYIHHFTMRKMKYESPEELINKINY
jgi:hypothetical protein